MDEPREKINSVGFEIKKQRCSQCGKEFPCEHMSGYKWSEININKARYIHADHIITDEDIKKSQEGRSI